MASPCGAEPADRTARPASTPGPIPQPRDPFTPVTPAGSSPVDLGGSLVFGRVKRAVRPASASSLTADVQCRGGEHQLYYTHSHSPQTPHTASPLQPLQLWDIAAGTAQPTPIAVMPGQESPVPVPALDDSIHDACVADVDGASRSQEAVDTTQLSTNLSTFTIASSPLSPGDIDCSLASQDSASSSHGSDHIDIDLKAAVAPPQGPTVSEEPDTSEADEPQADTTASGCVPSGDTRGRPRAGGRGLGLRASDLVTPERRETRRACHADPFTSMTPEARSEQRVLLDSIRSSASMSRSMAAMGRSPPPASALRQPRRIAAAGEKGLENPPGHNNCFLNVVLQTLFHVDAFRERLRGEHAVHTCTEKIAPNTCLFCSIYDLFVQYEFGQKPVLPPYLVRQILGFVFSGEGRFQLGAMEDVAECLEAVLLRLHLTACDKVDYCSPPCFVHAVFGCSVLERAECAHGRCTRLLDPFVYNSTVQYFPAKALYGCECPAHEVEGKVQVEACLRSYLARRSTPACADCRGPTTNQSYLLEVPEVFTMGIIWERTTAPDGDTMRAFADRIPSSLCLSDVYRIPGAGGATGPRTHGNTIRTSLTAICCFYGLHYTCYCRGLDDKTWMYFDDCRVSRIGDLNDVRRRIVTGRQQPVLLLFTVHPQDSVINRKGTPNPKEKKSKFTFKSLFGKGPK